MSQNHTNNHDFTQDALSASSSAPQSQRIAAAEAAGASNQMQPRRGDAQPSQHDISMIDPATAENTRQAQSHPRHEDIHRGNPQSRFAPNHAAAENLASHNYTAHHYPRPAEPRDERHMNVPHDDSNHTRTPGLSFADRDYSLYVTPDNQFRIVSDDDNDLPQGTLTMINDNTWAVNVAGGQGLQSLASFWNVMGPRVPLRIIIQTEKQSLDSESNFAERRGVGASVAQRAMPIRTAAPHPSQNANSLPIRAQHPAQRPADRTHQHHIRPRPRPRPRPTPPDQGYRAAHLVAPSVKRERSVTREPTVQREPIVKREPTVKHESGSASPIDASIPMNISGGMTRSVAGSTNSAVTVAASTPANTHSEATIRAAPSKSNDARQIMTGAVPNHAAALRSDAMHSSLGINQNQMSDTAPNPVSGTASGSMASANERAPQLTPDRLRLPRGRRRRWRR